MSAKEEVKSVDFAIKSFFAGGIAGMCAKTTVAPLERMKILLQAHNSHYKHHGVFSGLKAIVEKEKFLGLYKGNGAQMVRIFPYGAVQFMSFEMYKKSLKQSLGSKSHIGKFMAGSLAGVTAALATYPLDMVRARLAFQVTGEHIYNGIVHTMTSIVKSEGGVRALYKGLSPTLMGMAIYGGLTFYVFEILKGFLLVSYPNVCGTRQRNTGGLVLSVPAKLLCGGVSGAIAQTFSYPMDVARRRMQLSMMYPGNERYSRGPFSTLATIFQENGVVRGLYRGMSINYLRAIPMVAVSFSSYEVCKQILGLDTGVDS